MKIIPYNMRNGRIPIIGVCGASIIDSRIERLTENLGNLIADAGLFVVCGGKGGVMKAIAKGVRTSGGISIGIIPEDEKEYSNEYIDIIIPTGMGEARNAILVNTADIIVTISGSAGTLSEIALAWRSKKPIIALSTSGGWSEKLAGTQIDQSRVDSIIIAKTPEEVIQIIQKLLNS